MPMVATRAPYTLILRDDPDPTNPRQDGAFGKMICFHRRYRLGDEHDHNQPDDFLRELVTEHISANDVIAYIKAGKAPDVRLEYNRSANQWEVKSFYETNKQWFTAAEFDAPLKGQEDFVADALVGEMLIPQLYELAQRAVAILPLYLYDHSGITMSTSSFSCPWDSGQVGWIYADKESITAEYGADTPENREKALALMQGEVTVYDYYIRGECYGFELYNGDEEVDSCWGFLGDHSDLQADIEYHLPAECKGIMNNLVYRNDDPDIEDILREQEEELELEVG